MPSWDIQCQMFVALRNNEVINAENLLRQGLDPDTQFQIGNRQRSAICLCVERGNVELVELLLKWGCSINQPDASGLTALHIAASLGNEQMVEMLLNNRAHVNAVTLRGETPLHMASQRSSQDVVCRLVDAGAQLDRPDHERKTALLNACIHGHSDVTRYLIDHGADVNITSASGITPLLFVAISPHLDLSLMSCLLVAGACVNRQNNDGESALHAVMRGSSGDQEEAIDTLLRHNCDLNLRTNLGHTALHLAVLQRDSAAALRLVKAGCDTDPRDELGLPPLFYAVRDGNFQTTTLLLAAGVSLDDQDWLNNKQQCTSLDQALLEWLTWKRKQCSRLTEICRIAIRSRLTVPIDERISELTLPHFISEYLQLDRL